MRASFLVVAVALAVGGCGGNRTDATGAAGAATTTATATPSAGAGADVIAEAAAVQAAFPDWFPEDVYLPADPVITQVNETRGAHAVEVQTHGEVLGLAPQAQAAMLATGWTEHHYSPVDTRGGASMYYRKGNRSATLAMARGGAGQVRIMYNFATLGG